MELTVVIPTRNRRAIVVETLDRLELEAPELEFEAIVVDDGSSDDTIEVLERRSATSAFPLTLIRQQGLGPATARNRALAVARAPVCLFIDDDTWPRPGLLSRHAAFHRRRPEPEAALRGRIDLPASPEPSPFMTWLAGLHLGGHAIEDPENAGARLFFTGNVSVKTAFVLSVGGFDENFKAAGHEDTDLGHRLEERGMRLHYDHDAVVEHYHPTDLARSIVRMQSLGSALARFVDRYPDREVPRRPGLRHRVKATALTLLAALRVRTPRIQHETWRFLCHEAAREAYWDAVDRKQGAAEPSRDGIRIGRTLARIAVRDRDAQMPAADAELDLPRRRQAAGRGSDASISLRS